MSSQFNTLSSDSLNSTLELKMIQEGTKARTASTNIGGSSSVKSDQVETVNTLATLAPITTTEVQRSNISAAPQLSLIASNSISTQSIITLTVTTTTDQNNGSTGGLSLREAILAANNNTNNDYVILLQSGLRYILSISGDDAVGAVGDLDIVNGGNVSIKTTGTSSATINGVGLTQRDNVLNTFSGSTLRLENIVVSGGLRGINNGGDLTIINGGVTNNSGINNGAGIYNVGSTSITRLINTTVSGNSANYGGGIFNSGGGRLEVVNSTINNNISNYGGGIYLDSGLINLVNTTISSNVVGSSGVGYGGGIYSEGGTLFLNNVTVANNEARFNGGGIYNNSGVYSSTNTVIAGNTIGRSATSNDVYGNFFGDSYNLIGNTTGSTGFGGTDLVNVNARLGPLQNNGGSTFTHALLAGSPAINGGNNLLLLEDTFDLDGDGITNEPLPFDQRGLARISGAAVDIGAFEVQTASPLPTITLTLSPASVTEDGAANPIYTFTRSGASLTNPLTVNYAIAGTATNGTDYGNIGTNVTFAANSATATVTVDPTTDTVVETDETVSLTLASGTGYTIGTTSAVTGTITNDDTAPILPTITLALSPASVAEDGAANLVYTFTRSGASLTNPLTVNYAIAGTATNGTDYGSIGTSVTFAANSATATVIVDPTTDTTVETDETVSLTLVNNAVYTVGTTSAVTGTITNDDTAPTLPRITLTLNPSGISEDSPSNFIYAFTRTGSLSNALTVNFSLGGTATLNTDYSLSTPANSITFAANAATASLTINPTADTLQEANETVSLSLTNSTNYVVGTGGAVTATIINDDLTRRQQATTGNDVILGTTRGDILSGGTGNDTLTGGANGDSFNFNNPNEGIDTITDFTPDTDLILVSAAGFGGGLASGDITDAKFFRGTAATNANQRFIYNPTSGALSFDRDGNGSLPAVQFASLSTNLALTFEDIFVV